MPLHAIFTLWCTCIARAAINCVRNTPTRTGGNAKKADEHTTGRDKYINRKYLTWAIDYGYIGGMLYILDTVMSEVKFTAQNILIYQAGTSIVVCMLDILKVIFFSKLVAKAKTGKIIMLRERVAQTLSIEAVLLACFTQININMMYWAPLRDSVMVIGVDKWYELHISQLLVIYLQYIVISYIKDKIVMQIFLGPLLFCSIIVFFGESSFSIHYASFFLSVVLDQTVHSFDPPLSGDSDDDENDNESKTKPQPPNNPPQQPPQSRKTSMLKRSSDYVIILPSILEGNQENFD
mmetsp:Transcript_24830/g.27816  ORF Transcript_24830/g.27816 Transcript_24830/m.27816 type:complete len:293 (-) Transcript_24830:158-1036(-)